MKVPAVCELMLRSDKEGCKGMRFGLCSKIEQNVKGWSLFSHSSMLDPERYFPDLVATSVLFCCDHGPMEKSDPVTVFNL